MTNPTFYFVFDPDSGQQWKKKSACRSTGNPDDWYPELGQSTDAAKKVCLGCPVRDECLEWALVTGERHGVWGGLSERERRKLIAERARRSRARADSSAAA